MDGSQALDVARYYQGVGSLLPEIVLGAGATFLLLFETFAKPSPGGRRAGLIAAGVLALALVASVLVAGERATAFSGMVVVDPFVDFFRVLSCIAGLLGVALALRSDEIDTALRPEYYCLFLALVLGMILMASASDLLMAFIAVELMSLMSYVLAGLRRHDRRASEAALKYVVYGGAASGVMLVGFSLLYGLTGHTQFSLINQVVVEYGREVARSGLADPTKLVHMPVALTTGMVLSFAGFAYKIAAVPLHMWSPDVYEGAPTPFTAFLSTGPKAAGFAPLTRFFVVGFPDAAPAAQNRLKVRRPDVGCAIAERRAVARAAVMQFVGMQHHQLSGQGMARLAAIVEALDAAQRHADGVGVVAVRRIGRAGEASLDAIQIARRPADPVLGDGGQAAVPRVKRDPPMKAQTGRDAA